MSHLTSVRILDDLYMEALVQAEVDGVSVSQVINNALASYLGK